jgi:pyruvate/oxaloacetate carboxyltransferase
MGAVCTALEQTALGTGIRYEDIQALNLYWSQVRILYGCFEANVRASDSSVFDHEMPGGQYTNLMVSGRDLHRQDCHQCRSHPVSSISVGLGYTMARFVSALCFVPLSFAKCLPSRNQTEVHRSE